MRPSVGSLLEMAWGWGQADRDSLDFLRSELVQLPEGQEIPRAVKDLTGIQNWDLAKAISQSQLLQNFLADFQVQDQKALAIIHYGQFEKPFLQDLFHSQSELENLPFEIICSQKIAKKLLPQLPSRNLRGLAGYFGTPIGELKRAASHVQATFQIWQGLTQELKSQGVQTFEELQAWLAETKKTPSQVRYEYRIEKETRLKLPSTPGIYRMKAKSGDILYVGKATSLKNRVNSYFRGKKGRDRKKLEMLTQVWDLEIVQTATSLEAALLENDEIKRLDPPYNISLKAKDRSLRFFSKNFESVSSAQNEAHPIGPFRPQGSLDQLKILEKSLKDGIFYPLFYRPIPEPLLKEGFEIFCTQQGLTREKLSTFRSLLALGS